MDKHHLQRLREEQQKAISETQERIHTLTKFRNDYTSLQERMTTLPEKVTHNVMVPFGKKAFMPGKLVHTNEILVLLGDNWFVERSAKQAVEIVDRRLHVLDKQIEELDKQLSLLTPRLDFTSELQGIAEKSGEMQEIQEDYDPEKEKAWRERHKESVRRYNQQQREKHKQLIAEEEKRKESERNKREMTEAELWARLDELEKVEENQGELESSEESDSEDRSQSSDKSHDSSDEQQDNHRKVKWKDDVGSVRKSTSNVIWFSHTAHGGAKTAAIATSDESIRSPRDIYDRFATSAPKSILKPTSLSPRNESGDILRGKVDAIIDSTYEGARPRDTLPKSDISVAFSEKVVEKSVKSGAIVENLPVDSQQPKKISKFKARRMQTKS